MKDGIKSEKLEAGSERREAIGEKLEPDDAQYAEDYLLELYCPDCLTNPGADCCGANDEG